MFSICRQTHPATGIEHAVSCCFFNNDETCLVTGGANIIKVFRLLPEGHTKEVNAGKKLFLCRWYILVVLMTLGNDDVEFVRFDSDKKFK